MSTLYGLLDTTQTLPPALAAACMAQMGMRADRLDPPRACTQVKLDSPTAVLAVSRLEFPGERQPLCTVQRGHLWLAFKGSLDNRAEVLQHLGIDAAAADEPSDAELVLSLCERYGLDAAQHMIGDWVYALRDSGRHRLVLARDATGHSGLYWWRGHGGLVLFASSLPVLMAAEVVPRQPNARWLAGLLSLFSDPAHVGDTAYEGVQVVPQGHLLVLGQGFAELKRWWRPELLAPLYESSHEALEQGFVALYEDAVRLRVERANGSVAILLSGGLDSGSVAALAAPMVARKGQRLRGYVHTPQFDCGSTSSARVTDEWSLAQATARHVGHVDAFACTSARITPVEGVRRWLAMTATPSFAPSNWYWLQDLCGEAARSGARTLLVGSAGNGTVSYAGQGSLWHRARRGEWRTIQDELRHDQSGWAVALRERLVKPALRPPWHALRRAWANRGQVPAWNSYSLVTPQLASKLELKAAMRAAGHDPAWLAASPARIQQFRLSYYNGVENGTTEWAELGRSFGLILADPTHDRRLVEFCWRLPDELFWAHGRRRGLIRKTLRTALPEEVLDSTRRGLQSSDLRMRLKAHPEDLLAETDRVSRHPRVREWLDVTRLAASATAIVRGDETDSAVSVSAEHLLRALAVAMFIADCH